jgi:hypothetical protein
MPNLSKFVPTLAGQFPSTRCLSRQMLYNSGMSPAKRKSETREGTLEVRLYESEKQAFQIAADLSGIPLSSWVRERLRRLATRELEEANHFNPMLPSS